MHLKKHGLTEVILGNNIKVGAGAFRNNNNLEKISIGKNCIFISDILNNSPFCSCSNLKKVKIDSDITNFTFFGDCESIFIGNDVKQVHSNAFYNTTTQKILIDQPRATGISNTNNWNAINATVVYNDDPGWQTALNEFNNL